MINRVENPCGLISELFLISMFWIFATPSEIRNKAFFLELLCFILLSTKTLLIKIFLVFSTPPVNVNSSCLFHVKLLHINFSIDVLKQPLILNATFPVLPILTLFISTVFLMYSVCSHFSLLVWNKKSPFSTTKFFIWIETFSYPDISVKLIAWQGLLIILSEIEIDNSKPDIFPTTTLFWRELHPAEKVVRMFTLKLTELMSKVKAPGATTHRQITKA